MMPHHPEKRFSFIPHVHTQIIVGQNTSPEHSGPICMLATRAISTGEE
ncbi:Hypothetical protein GbCGDNIH1_8113 [Granulibacter bethesdensis CGDNIH1]|uniref:Uncharacterized protein n=1 Tax=Granulibacter bethesdensis (strain ATCC BAA-1260 / CGDNIH1) TaxID=391165 RepID=A0A286M394_GRABC|nr:Hypothetical protein GbCGDNIH5_8113 [Granulibacter bethesdensis]ASV62493.1 Hypothetical protein GbCGDNIH1_8113 [Granulibacter bethesdensis CGDNIH1]ASV62555.1 Hypothetical protein GbCGDNIH1I4_8113 [Granulibacter bethesdensis]